MKTKSQSAQTITYPKGAKLSDLWTPDPDMEGAYTSFGHLPVSTGGVSANASTIEYDTGHSMNYCLHQYDRLTVHDVASCAYVRVWNNAPYNAPNSICNSVWKGISIPTMPAAPPIEEATDGMRARAWDAMYPEINNGLQLAVSIYEFRDFPRLISTARRLLRAVTSVRSLTSWRSVRELTTDAFLSYNFGLLPMLSDIRGLANDVWNLQHTVNEFIEQGKKPRPYHYKEEISRSRTESNYDTGIIETTVSVMYYATCWISYDYKRPPLWSSLMRVGGLRITPSTVWNAIPWTFVIDWLVNVTDFLEQFDRDPGLTVKVHDYCDTIKSVSQNDFRRSLRNPSIANYKIPSWGNGSFVGSSVFHLSEDIDSPILWTWKRVHYKRVPGVPFTGYALPVLDSLSNRQLVLAGALLAAQR